MLYWLSWLTWWLLRRNKPELLIIIAGQSQATNEAPGSPYQARNYGIQQLSLHGQLSEVRQEPLSAAESSGAGIGSFMLPLADQLMDSGNFSHVILAPIAVGGSLAAQWADRSGLGLRLIAIAAAIRVQGKRASLLLWMHGEGDAAAGTSAEHYKGAVRSAASILAEAGQSCRWLIPLESYVLGATSGEIRRAQEELGLEPGFAPGPDFDQLNEPYRFDNLHFNRQGCQQAARMWADYLRRYGYG